MCRIETGTAKRLKKFLSKCREKCATRKNFQNSFDIARSHFNKGISKDPMRFGFDRELIAAIISQGNLNLEHSQDVPFLEIAVEGKVIDFEWIDLSKVDYPVQTEEAIHARVVVRETSSRKNIIITLYAWKCAENLDLPEIERYVW